jgi:phosphoglycolate phosphatase
MQPVKALFFDLDGTLVHTLPDIAVAVNILRRENGCRPLSLEQVRSFIGDGARKLVQRVVGTEEESFLRRFLEIYEQHLLDESTAYEGMEEVLDCYADRLLVCITNKPKALAERVLGGLRLRKRFRLLIGPEDVPRKKPDPAGIVQTLSLFSLDPGQVVMIGDHHTDMRAALAAGVMSCFCGYGYGHLDGLAVDASVARPSEILLHFN